MIVLVEETHTITIITIQIITATVITIQSNICYSNYLSKLLIIQTAKMVIMTKKVYYQYQCNSTIITTIITSQETTIIEFST